MDNFSLIPEFVENHENNDFCEEREDDELEQPLLDYLKSVHKSPAEKEDWKRFDSFETFPTPIESNLLLNN